MAKRVELEGTGPFELPVIQRVKSVALPNNQDFLVRLHFKTGDNKLVIVPLAPHCIEELVGLLRNEQSRSLKSNLP